MRIAFLLTTAAYAGLVVVAAATLPDRVPLHFGLSGDADRWGSRAEALVIFSLVGGGVATLLGGTAALTSRIPVRSPWVNVPHKEWWTATPEREERVRRRLAHDGFAVAAATMALLCLVLVGTIAAARRDDATLPGGAWLSAAVLGVIVIGVIALLLLMPRRYRPEAAR